jgi:DNA-binding LacI/PurR family transcriptional regulator
LTSGSKRLQPSDPPEQAFAPFFLGVRKRLQFKEEGSGSVRVSIKDIARVAGVSYSTVSRALNDSPQVNPQTKARVRRVAAEMGYLPSAVARSLVTRRSKTIGVVVTTITDLFFAEVIHGIEEAAFEHGHSVVLANSREQPQRELQAIRTLLEKRVDGIILVSGCSTKEQRFGEQIQETPLVVVNNVHQEHVGYSVEVDNVSGGEKATQHLLDLGHRRIAYISGPLIEWDAVERQQGYERALRSYGLDVDPSLIVRGGKRPNTAIEAAKQLLDLPSPPTALFCYNDATALGAMRAIRAAGLSVPKDISIIGFDDIDLAAYFEPPLTTVAQPKRRMAEIAVGMIIDMVEGRVPVESCVLPSHLVIRESTAAPSRSL